MRPPISAVPTRGRSPRTRHDGAGRARAHRNALQRDAAEVDVDGREAVAAVEEAGRGQAAAVLQRLDEAVEACAQPADQPFRLVEIVMRLGLHALTRRAADARAHLCDDLEGARWWSGRALVLALGDDLGERRQLLGHAAAACDQDPAPVGDVGDAGAASRCGRRAAAEA